MWPVCTVHWWSNKTLTLINVTTFQKGLLDYYNDLDFRKPSWKCLNLIIYWQKDPTNFSKNVLYIVCTRFVVALGFSPKQTFSNKKHHANLISNYKLTSTPCAETIENFRTCISKKFNFRHLKCSRNLCLLDWFVYDIWRLSHATWHRYHYWRRWNNWGRLIYQTTQ